MLHSILQQIWNQRRSTGWLFAELWIVFILMWYCLDVLYGFIHAERLPKGYDLEHVYKIRISSNPTQFVECTSEDSLQRFWSKPMEEVVRRIRQHPAVENAAMWLGTDAYTRRHMYQGYTVDSTRVTTANIRYVSPEYFDVMCIPLEQGRELFATQERASAEWNSAASPQPAVVTRGRAVTGRQRVRLAEERRLCPLRAFHPDAVPHLFPSDTVCALHLHPCASGGRYGRLCRPFLSRVAAAVAGGSLLPVRHTELSGAEDRAGCSRRHYALHPRCMAHCAFLHLQRVHRTEGPLRHCLSAAIS